MFNLKKKREKRKLVEFLARLQNNNLRFPDGYLESKKNLIELIEWLIASYEGKAGDPKVYLEAMINQKFQYADYVSEMERFNIVPNSEMDILKNLLKEINFLYYWVYYKRIVGF